MGILGSDLWLEWAMRRNPAVAVRDFAHQTRSAWHETKPLMKVSCKGVVGD